MQMRCLIAWLVAWSISIPGFADTNPDTLDIEVPSGETITLSQFRATGDRVLWLPSEFGIRKEGHYPLFNQLAALGNEVWLAELQESYFIAPGRSSLSQIPLDDVVELMAKSIPEDGRRLFIGSSGRGAVLTLLALQRWQERRGGSDKFAGMVFLHPNFQASAPTPGRAVEYLPIVDSVQAPIFIIQPLKSGKIWYLNELVQRLTDAGSEVYTQIIAQAGDGYQSRPHPSDKEKQAIEALPGDLQRALQLLQKSSLKLAFKPAQAVTVDALSSDAFADTLQNYPGNSVAPALELSDIKGKTYKLADNRGKVTVLNFWATWCPPCVKEIPSLGRLQQAFSKDQLEVWSVDIGESREDVEAFLKEVPAQFPVLLDSDGSMVKAWKIRAYPTTFVIDQQGIIKLAFFGGLEWDDAAVVKQLQGLVDAGGGQ